MTDNFLPDTKNNDAFLTVIFRILAGPKHFFECYIHHFLTVKIGLILFIKNI